MEIKEWQKQNPSRKKYKNTKFIQIWYINFLAYENKERWDFPNKRNSNYNYAYWIDKSAVWQTAHSIGEAKQKQTLLVIDVRVQHCITVWIGIWQHLLKTILHSPFDQAILLILLKFYPKNKPLKLWNNLCSLFPPHNNMNHQSHTSCMNLFG